MPIDLLIVSWRPEPNERYEIELTESGGSFTALDWFVRAGHRSVWASRFDDMAVSCAALRSLLEQVVS